MARTTSATGSPRSGRGTYSRTSSTDGGAACGSSPAGDRSVGMGLSKEEFLISRLMAETPRMWEDCCYDSFTFHARSGVFQASAAASPLHRAWERRTSLPTQGDMICIFARPRNADHHLRHLWETVQAMPDYRGTTTMIVTTDHGRGNGPVEWKSHGARIEGSDKIWIAVIGPDTPAGRAHQYRAAYPGPGRRHRGVAPGARLSFVCQATSAWPIRR